MAASSSNLTAHCPKCESLCLGPALLPCGHHMCRKCLRQTLQSQEQNPACFICSSGITKTERQTVGDYLDNLGFDPILEEVVLEELVLESDVPCQNCHGKTATQLCLDCASRLCDMCAKSHTKELSLSDHLLQDMNLVSTHARARAKDRAEDNPEERKHGSTDVQASEEKDLGLHMSLEEELTACKARVAELKTASNALGNVCVELKDVTDQLEREGNIVAVYVQRAARRLRAGEEDGRQLLPRLRTMKKDYRPPKKRIMDKVKQSVKELIRDASRHKKETGSTNTSAATSHLVQYDGDEEYEYNRIERLKNMNVFAVEVKVQAAEERERRNEEEGSVSTGTEAAQSPGSDASQAPVQITECETMMVDAQNIIVNVGQQRAELEFISDQKIANAVTETLRAKIDWRIFERRQLEKELHDEKISTQEKLKHLAERHSTEMTKAEGDLREERARGEAALEEAKHREQRAKTETDQLKKRLKEAEAKGRKGKDEQERLKQNLKLVEEELTAASERVADLKKRLAETQRKGDRTVAELKKKFEEEKRKIQSDVMTFVLYVEERDRKLLATSDLDEEQLPDVIQRLYHDLNVRLLGFDCGLRFLMETPVTHWMSVVERQLEVESLIENLLPEQPRVTWAKVAPSTLDVDVDLKLGQPLHIEIQPTSDVSQDGSLLSTQVRMPSEETPQSPDPMTAKPRMLFRSDARTEEDRGPPCIRDVIVLPDGRLAMPDTNTVNNSIKLVTLNETCDDLLDIVTVKFKEEASRIYRLASLPDGLVAVTATGKLLLFLNTDNPPSFKCRVKTKKEYRGVAAAPGGGEHLVATEIVLGGHTATVDIISRNGEWLKTILSGEEFPELQRPRYVLVVGNDIFVSDYGSSQIFKVSQTDTEKAAVCQISDNDLDMPCQMDVDAKGNLFVACEGSKQVMVYSTTGQWRELLKGLENRHPDGVCVLNNSIVIITWWKDGASVITGYELAP